MSKYKQLIDLGDASNDFGFSAVSEEELKELEKKLHNDLAQTTSQLDQVTKTYQVKLETLYKLVMPFLINLQNSPEKAYLYWPDRAAKVKEFVKKIDTVLDD